MASYHYHVIQQHRSLNGIALRHMPKVFAILIVNSLESMFKDE